MEEIKQLTEKNEALLSENKSLKEVIERYKDANDMLSEHVKSYSQTLNEVVGTNVYLKAGCSSLEKKLKERDAEIALLKPDNKNQ